MRTPSLILILSLVLPGIACRRQDSTLLDGRLEAYQSDLGPRVAGRLKDVRVQEGQRVKAGDLLALVEAEELDAAVARDLAALDGARARKLQVDRGNRAEDIAQGEARVQDAQAALSLAEENLGRARRLHQERILSQADLDGARTARDRAAANLELQRKALAELVAGARVEERMASDAQARQAQAVLQQTRTSAGFTEIRAPFDGVVLHRLREPGTVLGAGQPVLTLARGDALWVRVYIPQTLQVRVSVGQAATVETLDGRRLEGRLTELSRDPEFTPKVVETAEERVNLVYPGRVTLPLAWEKSLAPGQAVKVRIQAAP
ncbi:MAG: HlyD family efflux transporter periplasmic adaptor subunit [Acidobacteria bacterium]|nr:HlyD family efflux transporter periplasmic adaptor subunit [Acidobacteriota bacterium]